MNIRSTALFIDGVTVVEYWYNIEFLHELNQALILFSRLKWCEDLNGNFNMLMHRLIKRQTHFIY